ncbi:hypothetical protein K438DRAFT_1850948 [Mycena galopus ATCC 62051]|nr:hypothetical protein K438DRAFT_1850948 [Mycena galopus ATCC 62051]
MTKQVHFSSTNIMYSPLPWSPSSGASASSLPPSPSVATHTQLPESPGDGGTVSLRIRATVPARIQDEQPDQHPPPPVPIVYSPWPSAASLCLLPWKEYIPCPAHVNSLLSYTPFARANVDYNLSQPLHTINSQITPHFLNSATYPPLPTLTLLCRHIAWPIPVVPSQPAGFVSVLDVFTSVYTSLRLAVLPIEYDALPEGGVRQSVDNSYFMRCTRLVDEEERRIEASKGVKRVDFLAGKTCFLGLSGPVQADHVWELNVG